MKKPHTIRGTWEGAAPFAETWTLDEAVADVKFLCSFGGDWDEYEIAHDDGRRWRWQIKAGKPHMVEVDNKTNL